MVNTIFWDFDGVILNSLKIKGDGFVELFQKYKASDIGEGLSNARIYFKNSAGNTFSISDSDDDGIMTGRVNTSQPVGEYFVDYFRLEDDAQSDNYTYYRSGGLQET